MRAYVFIQTEPGSTGRLVKALGRLERLGPPAFLAGPYDVVVEVNGATIAEIEERVERDVASLPGIHRAQTFAVLDGSLSARPSRTSRPRSRAAR